MPTRKEILSILRADHKVVAGILERIMESGEHAGKSREKEFTLLEEALLPHAQAEEDLFYPRLMEDEERKQCVLEALEQHHVIKNIIHEMQSLDFSDEHWLAKASVLQQMIKTHVKEEESDLFDIAEDLFSSEERTDLGKQFETRKEEVKPMATAAT